jgi:AcrR family transcriptional regulator
LERRPPLTNTTGLTASAGLSAELLDATVRLLHSREVAGLTTRDIAKSDCARSSASW